MKYGFKRLKPSISPSNMGLGSECILDFSQKWKGECDGKFSVIEARNTEFEEGLDLTLKYAFNLGWRLDFSRKEECDGKFRLEKGKEDRAARGCGAG